MLKLMKSNHRTTRWPAVLLAAALLAAACGGDGDDRSAEEAAQARAEAAAAQAEASAAQSQAADAQAAAEAAAAELADARQALETAQAEAADAMEGGEASQEELAQARAELEAAEQAAEEARTAAEEAEAAAEAAEEARAAAEAEAEAALAAMPEEPQLTEVVVSEDSDIYNFDPKNSAGGKFDAPVFTTVYETLAWTTPSGEVLPRLATDWTISEDKRTYTFNLRQGVTFHNGEPFTAADVVYSVNRAVGQGIPMVQQRAQNLESVTAVDDYTVAYQLINPDTASSRVVPTRLAWIQKVRDGVSTMVKSGSSRRVLAVAVAVGWISATSPARRAATIEASSLMILTRNRS